MEEYEYIYTPYKTVNGKRIYAWQYGYKVFRLRIRKDRVKRHK